MSLSITKSGIITTSGSVNKNLVANSLINTTSSSYGFASRTVSITEGKTYTISARGYISNAAVASGTTLRVYLYKSDWSYCPIIMSFDSTSAKTQYGSFVANQTTTLTISSYSFKSQSTAGDPVTTIWYKMEEGSTPTVWVPNSSDSIYIGENIGFVEECINPNISSFTKSGQSLATEFIEI